MRKTGVVLKVDNDPVLTLPDYRNSSIPANMRDQRPQEALSIGTVQSSFRITKVTLGHLRAR